jgi:uncharacterized protein
MVEVRLTAVRVDVPSSTPVVLLQELAGARSLPIFIGPPEATAIAYALQGVEVPRPMTHDLMKDLVESLGAHVVRVVVTEMRDGTYFAEIQLELANRAIEVSSRPSDAIALALRTGSPLFVEDALMAEAGVIVEIDEDDEDDEEGSEELVGEFREFLDSVRPEDFSG